MGVRSNDSVTQRQHQSNLLEGLSLASPCCSTFDDGNDPVHVPLCNGASCKPWRRPTPRALQSDSTQSLAHLASSSDCPIDKVAPSGTVSDKANQHRGACYLVSNQTPDISTVFTVYRDPYARIVKLQVDVPIRRHQATSLHLQPVLRMKAEKEVAFPW